MDGCRRRGGVRTGFVVGSVWETRMKVDDQKGGSEVCNGDDNSEESMVKLRRRAMGKGVGSGKRKISKGDDQSFDGNDKNPIQKGGVKSSLEKNCGDPCKEVSVSGDGIKRSPVQMRKLKSEGTKVAVNAAVDKIDRRPSQTKKQTPEALKRTIELGKEVGESGEAIDKSPVLLKKVKSASVSSRNSKSESAGVSEVSNKRADGIPIDNEKTESDETCKEYGVCQEKPIPSNTDDVAATENPSLNLVNSVSDAASGEFDDGDDDEEDIDEENEGEVDKEDFDIKEINNVVSEVKKFNQVSEKPHSISLAMETANSQIHWSFSNSNSNSYAEQHHSKFQTLVDLIMWKDISRSAFVFMIGSFTIVSSSYAKDVNVSVISLLSYVGLVYLAATFLYRSLICRGVTDVDDARYVFGEEEATWVLTLILPYLNEFLLKLRALFSGDPATTMKMAVLLFVLARCGNSITIWKMMKFGFFGVFTVPKVCSLYSAQLTAHAKFWVCRFQDAWSSCTQKKAVVICICLLVWNLSSGVACIWEVFMLYVGFRYYQRNCGVEDDAVAVSVSEHRETSVQKKTIRRQRQWSGPAGNHQQ